MNKDIFAVKNLAEEVETVCDGAAYICTDCGDIIDIRKYFGVRDDNGRMICPHCGELAEFAPYSLAEHIANEVLDEEYTIDKNSNLIGVRLYVSLNGVTEWIDTEKHNVYRSGSGEQVQWYLPLEVCRDINQEIEECLFA